MDKDFMLNYYDKMVRPTWTELMKTPRYQRAACEHDKLEREFRRLLDEKLGRKYLELDDALFRVMDDIAEAMYMERMLLYRELDGLTLDKDVDAFRSRLEDRFGPIPPETEELLRIVPLRRLAARLGVEKVFLKGGRMSLFFVSNPDSPYYQSQAFGKVIAYMMKYTRRCDLREQNNKRSMLVKDVKTVEEAVCVLQEVVAMQVEE